jgi:hypothetical protein
MRFKRGSTSYGVLVLIFFVIAIVLFLPFFFKPPADEPFIPTENATRNKINIVTTNNNAVQFEAGNIILNSGGFATLDYRTKNYVLTYALESCSNLVLNYTFTVGEESINYNPLRQTPYLKDDGTLGLRAKSLDQYTAAILSEGVYKVTLQTQTSNETRNINSKGELYFRGSESPVTINFKSLCDNARLLVGLFEVEE